MAHSRLMRIGVLTTSFPRWHEDIPGHFVLGFVRALVTHGHTLEVLAPEPRERITRPSWPGIDVHWVPYMRPRSAAHTFYGAGVPDNVRRDPLALAGILPFTGALLAAALARAASWDAVVSHWALPCGLLAGLVRRNQPHVCVLHSADLHVLSRLPMRAALAAQIARGATRLLFVSDTQRECFLGWIAPPLRADVRARCDLQPMGIDDPAPPLSTEARSAARARLGLERFTLLTIARLVPVKGLHEAISALAARRDLEWLIAGEGPERARLQALAERTQLRVRLLGTVTGDSKQTLLRAADAFVLPSRVLPSGRSEGAPTALLEAMAHGLPVIASDVGGIGELVTARDTGLLIDPLAPDALVSAVDDLRGNARFAHALAQRGRAFAHQQRWSTIAPRLERMLLDSSNARPAAAIGYADEQSPLQKGSNLRS
jgi:glycosyltransferase involved in cell wall biosynthesis